MLTLMKRMMRSKLAMPFLAFAAIAMAVGFGFSYSVNDLNRLTSGGLVTVGDRSLSVPELDRRVENVLRNLNTNSSEPITKAMALEQGYVDQVFAIEESKTVNMGYASKIGATASVDARLKFVEDVDAFKNPLTGEFDLETYRSVLNNNRLTPLMYEQQVVDDLTLATLRTGAAAAIAPPPSLTALQASYMGETRDVEWFILTSEQIGEIPPATDEALRTFYDENIERFKQPERRAIDLVRVSTEDFISRIEVTDEEISTVYEATKTTRFSAPDTRTIMDLRFASRDAARAAFASLAAQAPVDGIAGITSNTTFAATRDTLTDPDMTAALFGVAADVGALFGPQEQPDGSFRVSQVTEIVPGAISPLSQVQETIRSELQRQRAEVEFYDALNTLDRGISAGLPIEEIASSLGTPVLSFAPVDNSGFTESGLPMLGLMSAEVAFQSVFDFDPGEVGERYDGDTAVFIASTRSIVPENTPPFDAIEDDVRAVFEATNTSDALNRVGEAIVARLEDGTSTLVDEATNVDAVVEGLPQAITRDNAEQSGLPPQTIQSVFNGKAGDIITLPGRGGSLLLIMELTDVTRPGPEEIEILSSVATGALSQSLANDLEFAVLAEIRDTMDVATSPRALNAYKATIQSDE